MDLGHRSQEVNDAIKAQFIVTAPTKSYQVSTYRCSSRRIGIAVETPRCQASESNRVFQPEVAGLKFNKRGEYKGQDPLQRGRVAFSSGKQAPEKKKGSSIKREP